MARAREQLLNRRLLDDAPGVHHDHPLAQMADEREVVRDVDAGEAVLALEVREQVEDLPACGDVER